MAKSKRLNESDKPVINFGTADDFHKLIIPQNTTANLALITPQEVGSLAYDTTLGSVVVQTGSGFTPVGSVPATVNMAVTTSTTVNDGSLNPIPLVFTAKDYDAGNHYNTTTGAFTVPVAGIYHITIAIKTVGRDIGNGEELTIVVNKDGTPFRTIAFSIEQSPVGDAIQTRGSISVSCTANQVLTFSWYDDTPGVLDGTISSFLMIDKVG